MISLRSLWFIVLFASTSLGFAQSTFVEVDSTPYDRQMSRIEPTLITSSGYAMNGLSLTLVNQWMIELRGMTYRYSREWRTPSEVATSKVADCKGKALALYDRLQLNGATNVRLVIGKRRANDLLTHTWLEWDTERGTLLLDPTFNWTTTFKIAGERNYVPFYAYDGMHKFQAGNSAMVRRVICTSSPAAPAHGVVTRPMRSSSQMRSTSWFDEGPVDPHAFLNRPPL
jgi:predicted transglutaminase-like cysteine proteinase